MAPEGRAGFSMLSPAAQVLKLRLLVPPETASDLEIAEFVLVVIARSGLKVGTPEHYKIREDLKIGPPKPWHKERPPKNAWEMQDPNRVPSWLEENAAVSKIAETLTFDDVKGGADIMAAAVRAYFNIGGLEDLN